ncbi:MAG: sporulation protein [Ruminococcaceae bacterium]|nr:sporulation protein [Oscillospiraceae bacterium]
MKRQWRCVCLLLCAVLVWFLADAQGVRAAAGDGLRLCARSVIPALFPFLVVTRLLLSLGFGQWLSPCLSGLMTPLFRLPGTAGSALVLGLVGGYPIGASTAGALYRQGLLTRNEAERLLTFCNNSNPVFLISVLGAGVFGSVRTGVWLWLLHLLSALLTGLLLRGRGAKHPRRPPPSLPAEPPAAFSSAFVGAVRGAAEGMLSICAFVVLFYVLVSPVRGLGGVLAPLAAGAVELFSMTPLLTPDRFGFVLAAAMSGWGGLSVLCQTAAALEGSGLPLRPCVLGKLVQGLLSAALALALSGYALP